MLTERWLIRSLVRLVVVPGRSLHSAYRSQEGQRMEVVDLCKGSLTIFCDLKLMQLCILIRLPGIEVGFVLKPESGSVGSERQQVGGC